MAQIVGRYYEDESGLWPRETAIMVDNLICTILLGIIIWFDISRTAAIIFFLLYVGGFESSKK